MQIGIGLGLTARLGGGGADAGYAFTAGDGLTASVVANGADWDVTMSDGVDSHTATFTTAELAAAEAHNVWPPVPAGPTLDVFSVPDVGWWFWPDSIDPVSFTVDWYMAGVYMASGLSWDASAESYAGLEVKAVITPDAGAAIDVIAQEAVSYVQNKVDTQGLSYWTSGWISATGRAKHTLAVWYEHQSFTGTQRLLFNSGMYVTFTSTGRLLVQLRDSASATIFYAEYTWDTAYNLVYVAVDMTVPSVTVYKNGSVVSMVTNATPLVAGTGILLANNTVNLFGLNATIDRTNGNLADLVYKEDEVIPHSTFWNGGTPQLLDGLLTTPDVYLGGYMTALEKVGNAAQGWQDGYNQGTRIISGSAALNIVDV